MNYFEITEIKESIKRYIEKTNLIKDVGNYYLVSTKSGKIFDKHDKEIDKDEIIDKEIVLKGPVFLIGYGKNPKVNEEYLAEYLGEEKSREWRLLRELFPERVGYIGAPFKPELMHIRKKDGLKIKLDDINKVINSINNKLEKNYKFEIKDFFFSGGKYFTFEDLREKGRLAHESEPEIRLKCQLANLTAGLIRFEKEKIKLKKEHGESKERKIKVLFIDNNPERGMQEIDSRFEKIFKENVTLQEVLECFSQIFDIYYYRKNFLELYQQIKNENKKNDLSIKVVKKEGNDKPFSMRLNEFDFILVDMFLGENKPNGVEFIQLLTQKYPHIPAFVLSVSDDYCIIRNAIKEGADFYILKNQVFSIPYVYWNYMDEIGKVIYFIKNDKLKKSIIGNIRYWMFKKELLWFGDKCYHMINHSYQHTFNDWMRLNEVLFPLLEENADLSKIEEDTDSWLYAICMATWLHDIGHKGTERYGEAYQIRDNHGYISAEYILKYPNLFRIEENDERNVSDNYYENIKFKPADPGSAIEILYKRIRKKETLTNAEKIALFCAYHKSNMPLTDEDYHKLCSDENKFIPIDFFVNGERKADNIITLEKILSEIFKNKNELVNQLIGLFALFRLVDGLDNHISRVGDESEKRLKSLVIENDRDYELSAIEKNINTLVKLYCKNHMTKALFVQRFDEDLKREIKEGAVIKFKSLEKLFPNQEEFENYLLHAYYASFISIQPTHFDFHSSIEELKIDYLGNKRFRFKIKTSKIEKKLKEMKVKERGRKETSVFDRLIGKEDCYVLKELNSGEKYLKEWINAVEILLIDNQGKELEKRLWPD